MRPEIIDGIPVAFCEASESLEAQREETCEWVDRWMGLKSQCCERPAAVFDIDATLLIGPDPIPSVINLYNSALRSGVTVFIITARSEDGREYTRQELEKHGIQQPRHLFMHPRNKPCSSSEQAGRAKERSRRRIRSKRFTIILNVGDAFHDHYTPPSHKGLHKVMGGRCSVFVDPEDGCAHVKLVHP